MIRRPPRSTLSSSSAASDVYKRQEEGWETIMVNCNPETVSTDYDTSDRLFFEPVTFEDVMNIIENVKPTGVIVQYGGQTPLNLAQRLKDAGAPIIGTSPESIAKAEDRKLFRDVVEKLNLLQPANDTVTSFAEAEIVACLLYTSPSPRDRQKSRMPSSA